LEQHAVGFFVPYYGAVWRTIPMPLVVPPPMIVAVAPPRPVAVAPPRPVAAFGPVRRRRPYSRRQVHGEGGCTAFISHGTHSTENCKRPVKAGTNKCGLHKREVRGAEL
jgi:hypothetical protein